MKSLARPRTVDMVLRAPGAPGAPAISGEFDRQDRRLLTGTLAEKVSAFGELSRFLIAARDDERRRIARELHDEIGQVLTALKINLHVVRRTAADPLGFHLEESIGIVEHLLDKVRDLSLDLRPPLIDDLGLCAALRWHVDRQAQRARLAAEFHADECAGELSAETKTACFRVAQEACANVIRHARASKICVSLQRDGAEASLIIRDDGVGFDVDTAQQRGRRGLCAGLLGMYERVSLLGGRFEIKSHPGRGTEVRARFPLPGYHGAVDRDGEEKAS